MTFQEWSDSIFTPISYFYDWLCQVADSLINNYIVQTLLCLSIIISLFWLISNYIISLSHNKLSEVDDYTEKLHNYELYKKVQNDYISNHWDDELNIRYKNKILSEEVSSKFMKEAQDLDVDNRVLSLENQSIARKEYSKKLLNDNKIDSNNSNININNDSTWVKEYDIELKNQINDDVNRIMSKNNSLLEKKGLSYDSKNNVFFDTNSGEVVEM